MKLKKIIVCVLCMVAIGQANAQRWPGELWHEGKVVLVDGDTLKGLLKYDLVQDLVQYELKNVRTEAYSARKVLFFEIFDNSVHQYRTFFSLPYNAFTDYKTPTFFELLAQGKLTLLSREHVENRVMSSPYGYGYSYSREVMVFNYYLLTERGDIDVFTGGRGDLLKLMGNKRDKVEQYSKENKLRYDEKYDLSKIVQYYNTLF